MPRQHLNPDGLFPSVASGFSQIVVATGTKTVFLSGQVAWDAEKRIVGGGDLAEQTRQALRNIGAAMHVAGGTLDDVVALRIYVVNYRPEHAETISAALRAYFPHNPPASTWIGVSALAVPDFLIEIEATAVLE